MNSLEWINGQIEECKQSIQQSEIRIDEDKKYPSFVKCHKERIEELKQILKVLEQIKTELEAWEKIKNKDNLKSLDEIKYLCREGDIFSANEFIEDYESCLRGDGTATFVTKDLEVIEDFNKGWDLLKQDRIAFVAWFNR